MFTSDVKSIHSVHSVTMTEGETEWGGVGWGEYKGEVDCTFLSLSSVM